MNASVGGYGSGEVYVSTRENSGAPSYSDVAGVSRYGSVGEDLGIGVGP